jgi:hypothetical protein
MRINAAGSTKLDALDSPATDSILSLTPLHSKPQVNPPNTPLDFPSKPA